MTDEEARKSFINRLIREDRMALTNQSVLGGGTTTEKGVDAQQASSRLQNLMIMFGEPTSGATCQMLPPYWMR